MSLQKVLLEKPQEEPLQNMWLTPTTENNFTQKNFNQKDCSQNLTIFDQYNRFFTVQQEEHMLRKMTENKFNFYIEHYT